MNVRGASCRPPFAFDADVGCVCDAELLACDSSEQPDLARCECVESCIRTGCNLEVCASEITPTPCVFLPWHLCFESALCEAQEDGECDWTPTAELLECLRDNGAP